MELINLKNLSSTAVALQIWESPNIKDQVRNLFLVRQRAKIKYREHPSLAHYVMSPFTYYQAKEPYIKFQSIIKSAVLNLDLLELPFELKNSCKTAVQELGERIYEWCGYVTETLDFDFKFAEKIYFKLDRSIDEDKIFATWENDQEFLNHETTRGPAMHILACINVNENFIFQNLDEMQKHLNTHWSHSDLDFSYHNNKIYTIVALYLYIDITISTYYNNYSNINYIIPPNEIFSLCVCAGFKKAALYFWKFIPNPSLPVFINAYLNEITSFFKSKYQKEKSIEMIIFFINQMTMEQKTSFLQEKENVVKLFDRILPAKPDDEIISELIENYLLGLSKYDHQSIFVDILDLIEEYSYESTKHKRECFCSVFHKILTKLPDDLKRRIFNVLFFKMLSKIPDIKILKLILNFIDPNLRFEILGKFQNGVKSLLENKDWEKFDQFMKNILISDDERNFFKRNLLDQFLIDGNFEIINELFDYFSMPPEEIKIFKENENCKSAFECFIRSWRYDKAEKFLEWMFPDEEEEKENYRNSLTKNSFFYEKALEKSDKIIGVIVGDIAKSKDFYKYFLGFPHEEKSVQGSILCRCREFRKKLENFKEECDHPFFEFNFDNLLSDQFRSGKKFFNAFYDFFDESELTNLYMKWICHDKNRREAIRRKYASDVEKEFFKKLMCLLRGLQSL